MFKKLLIATAVVLGLFYGSGHDLSSLKHAIDSTSSDTAISVTGGDGDGWGSDSHY